MNIQSVADALVLLPILQVVLLIIGVVRLFKKDERNFGYITIGNSLLYILGIFLIENGYLPILCNIIFLAVGIYLGFLNLWENLGYDKKLTTISLIVYGILLLALVTVQILVSKQSIAQYFNGFTLVQLGYITLFVCMGIRHLNIGTYVVMFIGVVTSSIFSGSSDNDPAYGATGNEESVDTVSMSD